MENKKRLVMAIALIIGLLVILPAIFKPKLMRNNGYDFLTLSNDIKDDNVDRIDIYPAKEVPTGKVDVYLKKPANSVRSMYTDNTNKISYLADKNNVPCRVNAVENDGIVKDVFLPILGVLIVAIVIFVLFTKGQGGANVAPPQMNDFGKSKAKRIVPADNKVTFKDVAGCDEEKDELEEIVDFLKNPEKYNNLGARIPKGILLVGPPGTGKTLLARAIAGEAEVPFFSISGSDFVEMYVGVGASRVRDLFSDAKKNAPCIVFIDEIDAVARKRGAGLGGSHDEREQTLNQMLVEMDGFTKNSGIIVLAATNRVDILDPAILRPGRFDRKIGIGAPDVKGREAILKIHARDKRLSDDVDLDTLARTTAGMTGADLENMLNEAAILAAKKNKAYISGKEIHKAFIKVGIGTEKKSKVISDKERRITAIHESGHAVLFHVLPDMSPVHTISIIPTGMGAAGYTMPLNEEDKLFNTKGKMLQEIMVDLGGRIAEEISFDDVTTGASQDIKHATALARAMVTKFGMSKNIGPLDYVEEDSEVFIGRDLGHTKSYSDNTAEAIDKEIKRIVEECYLKAKEILVHYQDVLNECAEKLLEKEKLGRDDFEELFKDVNIIDFKQEIVL